MNELARDKNYQYGIFARIKSRRGWNEEQVKRYMDKNNISYKKEDTMKELVEALKCHEDKKYI
tara:strand:+ start:18 stop:206 length:189 start_codon:yes stop_codon:yes gene_type:complete